MVSYSGTLLFALITFFVAPSQLVTLSHSNIDYNELFRLTPRQCIHTIHQFFSIITFGFSMFYQHTLVSLYVPYSTVKKPSS